MSDYFKSLTIAAPHSNRDPFAVRGDDDHLLDGATPPKGKTTKIVVPLFDEEDNKNDLDAIEFDIL